MGFYDRPGRCKNVRPTVRKQKKRLWEFFDIGFVSNFSNKHSWRFFKFMESAITHFSFFCKNWRNELRSATHFLRVTYQWLFCYFCFWNIFLVTTSKKICDGRRKTKIKKLTLKNKCEKIKKAAELPTLTAYKWFENAVRPSFATTSVTRKFWFVHLIQIIHLVLYGPNFK